MISFFPDDFTFGENPATRTTLTKTSWHINRPKQDELEIAEDN